MLRFLAAAALVLAALAPSAAEAAAPVDVAMPIEANQDALVAALAAARVDAKRENLPGGGTRFTYKRGGDAYTVDATHWPKPGSPESAYKSPSPSDPIVVTRVHIAGPSSAQKRNWLKSFERDGRAWAKTPEATPYRSPEEKKRYGVSAFMQWWDKNPDPHARARVPSVTWLFQSERPANTPMGTEPTILDVTVENPWHGRRF